MKILQVYKDFYPPVKGGIESHLNLLTNGLRNSGVDVEVLVSNTYSRFEEDKYEGIRIIKVPQLGRFYSAPLTPTFHRYLKRYGSKADIIHFHHPNPTAELSYFFTDLKKKIILTYHSDIIRQDKLGKLYSPFRKMFLEKTDRIIATSPNYIYSSNVLKHFKHKCTVIPLGTDIERFLSDTDSSQIEKIKRENGRTPLILFVGCFRYYKGLHLLVSAMKDVQAKLLLIGAGPEELRLRRIVERNNLSGKILFLGELPDQEVNAYYKACDIFVLPSHLRSEAFGLVQLEAMCCKKPIVSTELATGTSFVNINGKTGITVRPNDVIALSNAINYLIDHPEKRIQYGECGFKRVNQFFTTDRMVEKTIELYRAVINEDQHVIPRSFEKNSVKGLYNKKVKVLRVISRLNIGGVSLHVNNLTEYLDTNKFITRLITGTVSAGEGDMTYITKFKKNVRVAIPDLQREISPYRDLKALFKVIEEIHHFKPDIIDSHTSKAGAISRIAAIIFNLFRKRKLIIVHTFHGNVLSGYFSRAKSFTFLMAERLLATFTDMIIAISQTQKWELLNKYKIGSSKKISIVKLGFNLEPFQSAYRHKRALRKKLCISEETLLIGMVGRMAPIKNHRMFLEAGKLLIENQGNKKITLLLVGDGEERQQLEDYTDSLGIRENVVFYGWEKNIAMIYADIDILALTSLNEGTPVSVIEAMVASVPVITTGVGGIKDLLGPIHPGQPNDRKFHVCERGILCPKNDPVSFAHGLNYMVSSNYLNEKYRFDKACSYVLKNYSMERLVIDMESLYGRLVTARGAYRNLS